MSSLDAADCRRSRLHQAPGPLQASCWRAASPPLPAAPLTPAPARAQAAVPAAGAAAGAGAAGTERVREGALGSAMGIWRNATKRLMDLEAQIVRTVRTPGPTRSAF
jgi:hypothetical protein